MSIVSKYITWIWILFAFFTFFILNFILNSFILIYKAILITKYMKFSRNYTKKKIGAVYLAVYLCLTHNRSATLSYPLSNTQWMAYRLYLDVLLSSPFPVFCSLIYIPSIFDRKPLA